MYARSCVSVYPNNSRKKACVSTKRRGHSAARQQEKKERKKEEEGVHTEYMSNPVQPIRGTAHALPNWKARYSVWRQLLILHCQRLA